MVTVPMTTEMSKSPLNNDETIQSYETAWYRKSVNRLFAQSMQIVQVLQHTFSFTPLLRSLCAIQNSKFFSFDSSQRVYVVIRESQCYLTLGI